MKPKSLESKLELIKIAQHGNKNFYGIHEIHANIADPENNLSITMQKMYIKPPPIIEIPMNF